MKRVYPNIQVYLVYLHSFICYCLRNTRNVAKFQENLTLQQFKVIQGTPPLEGSPLEFLDETYPAKTRGMGLPYGENFIILASTVFV